MNDQRPSYFENRFLAEGSFLFTGKPSGRGRSRVICANVIREGRGERERENSGSSALELFVLRSRRLRAECNPQMSSSCRGKLLSCLAFNPALVASSLGNDDERDASTAGIDFSIRPRS